jgi:D-glycero-beta-D-manno-heptose 1-phosphate adenylyltransferase
MDIISKKALKKILQQGSNIQERFIADHAELKEIIDQCKQAGYRVVLTQGVYDLIHEGHAAYLEKARSYGDLLVVAVDSDQLTKQRKGPQRPIVPQQERLNMLVHLRHVDIVTLLEIRDDKGDLIEMLSPHVLVLSETTSDIPDSDIERYQKLCEQVIVLPPQAVTTTTARIRNLTIEGAHKLAAEIHEVIEKFLSTVKVH